MIKSLVCPECGTDMIVYEEVVPVHRNYLWTRTQPDEKHVFESESTSFFESASDEKLVCEIGHEFPVPDEEDIEWE